MDPPHPTPTPTPTTPTPTPPHPPPPTPTHPTHHHHTRTHPPTTHPTPLLQHGTERIREWFAARVLKPLVKDVDGAHTRVIDSAARIGWTGVTLQPLDPQGGACSRSSNRYQFILPSFVGRSLCIHSFIDFTARQEGACVARRMPGFRPVQGASPFSCRACCRGGVCSNLPPSSLQVAG